MYLAAAEAVTEAARIAEAETYLRRIRRFHPVPVGARLLEVGVGTGWFLVYAAKQGLRCDGVEVNPVNARHADLLLAEHRVNASVQVGSIEDAALPSESYDVVVAMSVFEHVRRHRDGLSNVYSALRPGGVLYFYSTNKFSPKSGEYPMPLYGWLPNHARYRIRVWRQGPSIISSSGVDFHQFTYRGLRRTFREVGFSRVVDQYEMLDPADLGRPTQWKRALVAAADRFPPFVGALRTFAPGTCFICVK